MSKWHRIQSWLFQTLCKGDYEHLQHLIGDVIQLERENKYLRDIVRPNSTEINIPSVWIGENKTPPYITTTNTDTTSYTYYVPSYPNQTA